jgi:hypothetical protein
MASRFDVTTPTTTLALDESRSGLASFTVTSTDPGTIGGDAVVVPAPGAASEWFSVKDPSRTYPPGQTEQLAVAIAIPPDAPAGRYGFRLRVMLAGGVPEEDFDDSPVVTFDVATPPEVVPEPPPAKKPFPWWIVVLVGAIVVAVIGVAAFFLLNQPAPGRLAFHDAGGGMGSIVCEIDAREGEYRLVDTEGCTDEAARSLVMVDVPANIAVGIFGSPTCQTETDSADVRTQEAVSAYTVGSFEVDVSGPPVAVDYRPTIGPWIDTVRTFDPERIAVFAERTGESARNLDLLEAEVAREGLALEPEAITATELTPDSLRSMLEGAQAAGSDTVVVDAGTLTEADRSRLAADVAVDFGDLEIIWPLPFPDGLDGKVSCVRVSQVSA